MLDTSASSKCINRLLEARSRQATRRRRCHTTEDDSRGSASDKSQSTRVCDRLLEPILTVLGIVTAAGACFAAVFAITLYRFTNLKRLKPEVNVRACVGGGPEGCARFQLLVKERKTRIAFVPNSAEWLRRNRFEGLLIYWKYLGAESRVNFTVLLLDLKNAFLRDKLSLSAVLPFSSKTRRDGYYVQSVFECLDVVLLDGHRAVEPSTFPITTWSTPLQTLPRARHYGQYGLVRVLDDLAIETDEFEKAVLSVSAAGLSFTLRYRNIHRAGAAVSAAGSGGPRTNQSGIISYYVTKQLFQNYTSGWKKMYHKYGGCPFAVSDDH